MPPSAGEPSERASAPTWSRAAQASVRRGPAAALATLGGLREWSSWFARVRELFATPGEEGVEHLETAEWYLDNYTHVQRALRQVREDMPSGFYRKLPALVEGAGAGLPRAYVLARSLLRETGLVLDASTTRELLREFQETRGLSLAELWALPVFLRLATIEELARGLAQVWPDSQPPPGSTPAGALGPALDVNEGVARCIRGLRLFEHIDWKALIVAGSLVEQVLAGDPARVYTRMDFETRDRCRQQVEQIAWRTGSSEDGVARAAVELARAHGAEASPRGHVGYYLIAEGRAQLEQQFGYSPPPAERLRRALRAAGARALIPGIVLTSALILLVPLAYLARRGVSVPMGLAVLALLLVPASTLGVTIVQWFLTSLLPPGVLPKLDYGEGIEPGQRALVVVPCLLGSTSEVQGLVRQLELHYLRNPDPELAFALLSDWLDAPEALLPGDDELLERAAAGVRLLNRKHGRAESGPFHLFHRERQWNPSQGVWMGWERKRGKLEQLDAWLLGHAQTGLEHGVGRREELRDVRYVITLDAGTVLPTGAAARLVGTLAHPLNRAEFDERSGRVVRGYTVLQPRVEIAPTATAQSRFTHLFAGDAAIDIYSRAVSDVYQDLCGEGIYVGKGIYEVASFARSLQGRVRENTLVSHDHFEGLHGRAGLVSDIVLYEDYPPQYLAYARRMHRWIRGDWQLLPWLAPHVPHASGARVPNRLTLLGRWILFDNLRRSLLAPTLLLLLASAWLWFPGRPLVWTALALLAPAGHVFTGLISGVTRGPRRARVRPWIAGVAHNLAQSSGRWGLYLVFLVHEALVTSDAIVRTLYRLFVSRRNFLEWRTAEHTAQLLAARHPHLQVWSEMAASPVLGLGLLAAVSLSRPALLPWIAPLLLAWIAAPELARRISRPVAPRVVLLDARQRSLLRRVARRTWAFFETFVVPLDQWLPPDNYQEEPKGEVAHRTSPTNVGMYLVSASAAHDLGWIGSAELLQRLCDTLDSLERMQHYRGHLFNWYDTRTLEPLLPRYISTVDSGNLAAALLIVQQACAEVAAGPLLSPASWEGLADELDLVQESLRRTDTPVTHEEFRPLLARVEAMHALAEAVRPDPWSWEPALRELSEQHLPGLNTGLVTVMQRHEAALNTHALDELQLWLERVRRHLGSIAHGLDKLAPWLACVADFPVELRSKHLFQEVRARLSPDGRLSDLPAACEFLSSRLSRLAQDPALEPGPRAWSARLEELVQQGTARARSFQDELLAFGVRADRHVREMDFGLLYDRGRKLLHIGYDLSSGRLDPNHYDLLASEARITSFLAIAKGDVPLEHWYSLERPMTRVRGQATLLSWGGTMFEYLMPTLFMQSGVTTLLSQSCRVAVDAQLRQGAREGVPWGVSEAGYYHFDAERNYQYRAFGVSGLGLKRGLSEDLVIAPYASMLALELRPQEVVENLERIEALGGLGSNGLYEALDFTPERVPSGARFALVRSHMAHHQGMILASIDNFLERSALVRRFHATSYAHAAELLLHEQVPMGVSPQMHPEEAIAPPAALGQRRELAPWRPALDGPMPQTHILSNGQWTTALTDAGAGWSAWRGLALTRAGGDCGIDECGTWVYVRDEDDRSLTSFGMRPTGTEHEEQRVIFHAHMVEIQRRTNGFFLRMEVAVAPHSDVEVRRLEITNETDRARRVSISSCLEPVLALARDDLRHPAFSKLFLESEALPELRGLLFRRRPRSPEEPRVVLVHTLVPGPGVQPAGHESDRARFLGRCRSWRQPLALSANEPLSRTTGTVIDPVGALQSSVQLASGASAQLAFVSAAAESEEDALEASRQFRSLSQIEWIFKDAGTAIARELRALRLPPRFLPVLQRLGSAMLQAQGSMRCDAAALEANRLGKPRLWGRGVSGDVPSLLVELEDNHGARLLSEVLLAHRWWRRCGLSLDLLILLAGTSSYSGEDEQRVARLIAQTGGREHRDRPGGIFVLHADQMQPDELRLFRVAARVVLHTSAGSLSDQLAARESEADLPPRFVPGYAAAETHEPTPELEPAEELSLENAWGGFCADGREYVIQLAPGVHTPAPWCNVLANPHFGCLVSESALGCTWSMNASERRLTPWRNDPVADPPSAVVYLRDEETGNTWTPTPLPLGGEAATRVRHGAGWTEFQRSSHGLEQSLRVFVPRSDPLQIVRLHLRNRWKRPRRLTICFYAETFLGTRREEFAPYVVHEYEAETGALLALNPWDPEHAERMAFLASDAPTHGFTTDRHEFLGRAGRLDRPPALERWGLSGRVRSGGDPCQALMVHVELQPGEEQLLHYFYGDAQDREGALELVRRYRTAGAVEAAWEQLGAYWDGVLGAIEVETPDPAMDFALNRWLLYQSISSRIEGRTGPYQSSGAFGFRDQLQDVMALVHGAPERVREHLLTAAARQFEQGDVLHWWHPPAARGVRTRCSDDLLWLPFVACHYAAATGDLGVFDVPVPFLHAEPLGPDELERYGEYSTAPGGASLLEHCRRAVQRGLTSGAHGLPLIGSCDWNDGFSRVGPGGRGESVWLACFALATLNAFAQMLERLDQREEAQHWRARGVQLRAAIEDSAWDGAWYLRAWFDDGTPLGSAASHECRIDVIAQAWAVLAGAADAQRAHTALESAASQLVSREDSLVRLLRPPFDESTPNPGYIQAYPPGVRENGGQYTHAATWLGWAYASLGEGASAHEIFSLLNPLERGRSSAGLERYRVEPYVVAADVYAGAQQHGRGGWTWYTGAAAWLWRLGVEALLGIRRVDGKLGVEPCLPPSWDGYQAVLRRPACVLRVRVTNPGGLGRGVTSFCLDGRELEQRLVALDELSGTHELLVILGGEDARSEPAADGPSE